MLSVIVLNVILESEWSFDWVALGEVSLCWWSLYCVSLYCTSLYCVIILCHYTVSLYCVIILCHYTVSLYCVIMLMINMLSANMLSVITMGVYVECRSVDCHSAECCGARSSETDEKTFGDADGSPATSPSFPSSTRRPSTRSSSRCQCYKTFLVRNLGTFVIS